MAAQPWQQVRLQMAGSDVLRELPVSAFARCPGVVPGDVRDAVAADVASAEARAAADSGAEQAFTLMAGEGWIAAAPAGWSDAAAPALSLRQPQYQDDEAPFRWRGPLDGTPPRMQGRAAEIRAELANVLTMYDATLDADIAASAGTPYGLTAVLSTRASLIHAAGMDVPPLRLRREAPLGTRSTEECVTMPLSPAEAAERRARERRALTFCTQLREVLHRHDEALDFLRLRDRESLNRNAKMIQRSLAGVADDLCELADRIGGALRHMRDNGKPSRAMG